TTARSFRPRSASGISGSHAHIYLYRGQGLAQLTSPCFMREVRYAMIAEGFVMTLPISEAPGELLVEKFRVDRRSANCVGLRTAAGHRPEGIHGEHRRACAAENRCPPSAQRLSPARESDLRRAARRRGGV